MKLYVVTLTSEIVVRADSIDEANDIGLRALRNLSSSEFSALSEPMSYLPGDWELDSMPFGKGQENEPDIQECIEKGEAPKYSLILQHR